MKLTGFANRAANRPIAETHLLSGLSRISGLVGPALGVTASESGKWQPSMNPAKYAMLAPKMNPLHGQP